MGSDFFCRTCVSELSPAYVRESNVLLTSSYHFHVTESQEISHHFLHFNFFFGSGTPMSCLMPISCTKRRHLFSFLCNYQFLSFSVSSISTLRFSHDILSFSTNIYTLESNLFSVPVGS